MNPHTQRWNQHYQNSSNIGEVAKVLADFEHLLPQSNPSSPLRALDVACGLGANALFLAHHHFSVDAYDISDVALEKLNRMAKTKALTIHTELRDVEKYPPDAHQFDAIVVCRFLHRDLCPYLINALKPQGLLFYQTFCLEKSSAVGPSNPNYLLHRNELVSLFYPKLKLLSYREEGMVGDRASGFRNEAYFIGEKIDD